MNRFLTARRIGGLFFGLFAVALVGLFGYQHFFRDPEQKCEARGGWWYEGDCETPIYLPDITHRPAGVTRAEASAEQNRELVEIEHRLEAERTARTAAIARDRKAFEARTQH